MDLVITGKIEWLFSKWIKVHETVPRSRVKKAGMEILLAYKGVQHKAKISSFSKYTIYTYHIEKNVERIYFCELKCKTFAYSTRRFWHLYYNCVFFLIFCREGLKLRQRQVWSTRGLPKGWVWDSDPPATVIKPPSPSSRRTC